MPEVKGRPHPARQKLGSYEAGQASVGDAGAVCEQLHRMQVELKSTHRSIAELLEMNRQMLESMQHQHQAVARLIERVDRASKNGDDAVKKMCDSAEAMKHNTDMIVRASLIAAFSLADEEKFERASRRAEQEMKRWKSETRTLRVVSKSE